MFSPLFMPFDLALTPFRTSVTATDSKPLRLHPPVDITENAEALKIRVEMPGLRVEDTDITIEDGVLRLKASRPAPRKESGERAALQELRYGLYERAFILPDSADTDHVDAAMQDGILTLTIPKQQQARPRRIPVRAGPQSGQGGFA